MYLELVNGEHKELMRDVAGGVHQDVYRIY